MEKSVRGNSVENSVTIENSVTWKSSFIVKFHRIHNQCKIYSQITVKGNLRPTILMKHLTFVHHESMQHNQNYCNEKAT